MDETKNNAALEAEQTTALVPTAQAEEPEEDTPEPEAPRTVEELWREYQKKEK